jgi:polyisoprenoid-binding protein YceI
MALSTWNIDASHSTLGFSVRHLVIAKVHGKFTKFNGAVKLDEQDLAASEVNVTLEAASIDTSEPKRDEHLRSADFFDVVAHPQLTFASKRIEKTGADAFKVTGDLSIHGVKKEVALDVEYSGKGKDPWGNERVAFTGKTSINRTEFGLKWNQALEAGGVLVGEKIEISFDVQAVKAA